MAFFESKDDEGPKPLRPIWGLIMFVIVGGISAAVSGSVLRYVSTATLRLGALGLPVLPIVFPAAWPTLLRQIVVGGVVFLFLFVPSIIVLLIVLGAATPKDPLEIDLKDIRKEKAQAKRRR